MVALPALIFWLLNFPFMLMVYQEPMILQWDKVVTVIPLTINSQDNSDEDYRPGPQVEEEGYGTASAQQDQMGGAQRRGRALRTSTKWPSDTMIVTEVDIVGMPVPELVARQKIPLNLPDINELSNDEKWDLFDKHVQKHLKFQEDAKPQAFKLFWKTTAKAWRQFRFQLRRDFIKKGLEPFTRHMLTVKIRQPSHEFTFGVGMTFVSYPLVLTPVV
jgi:hypothetical protein